jgi:hypothetical protein
LGGAGGPVKFVEASYRVMDKQDNLIQQGIAFVVQPQHQRIWQCFTGR